ncbi:hypothetical protein FPQ18DRAFT_309988 [Pyronema domesticum]|nr:hypothetical protein FPQ18DRAFT_309988 [Pyronema domesticum]
MSHHPRLQEGSATGASMKAEGRGDSFRSRVAPIGLAKDVGSLRYFAAERFVSDSFVIGTKSHFDSTILLPKNSRTVLRLSYIMSFSKAIKSYDLNGCSYISTGNGDPGTVDGLHNDLHHANNALAALSRVRNFPGLIVDALVPFIKLRSKILDEFNDCPHSIIDNSDKCPRSKVVMVLRSANNSASSIASFLEDEKFANQALVHFESLKYDKNCAEMKEA